MLNFIRKIKMLFWENDEAKELKKQLDIMTSKYKEMCTNIDLLKARNEQLQKRIDTLQSTNFLMEEITKRYANDVISTQVATNFVVEPAKPLPSNVKVQSRNIKAIANKSTVVPRDPYAGTNKNDELSKLNSTDFFTY